MWQGIQIEALDRPFEIWATEEVQGQSWDMTLGAGQKDDSEKSLKYNYFLIEWLKRKYYRIYDNTLKDNQRGEKKSETRKENQKSGKQNIRQSEVNKENEDREKI